jgi:hypothetical protein
MKPNRTFIIAYLSLAASFFPCLSNGQSPTIGSSLKDDQVSGFDDKVMIWSHFMPMVPNASLHSSIEGNNDAWPLNSQSGSNVEDYKEHMQIAVASGVSGFQMLMVASDDVYEAARQFKEETGKTFYISPEWCDSMPNDPVLYADKVADFYDTYKDNPNVYKVNGKPLVFTYHAGKWELDPEGVHKFFEQLKGRGANVLVAPTIWDKLVLDRMDLGWRAWPDHEEIKPGEPFWVKFGWKAGTTLSRDNNPKVAVELRKRFAKIHDFLWIPGVGAGYDSSNRPLQAIRIPFKGLHTLIDGFQTWRNDCKQFTLNTWNDCNETLSVPSSRNIWGYNAMIRYFHELIAVGKSPYKTPQFVVAYPVECLYGDKLDFQVVEMPATDTKAEFRANVELIPVNKADPIVLKGETSNKTNNELAMLELNWSSGAGIGTIDAVQPR